MRLWKSKMPTELCLYCQAEIFSFLTLYLVRYTPPSLMGQTSSRWVFLCWQHLSLRFELVKHSGVNRECTWESIQIGDNHRCWLLKKYQVLATPSTSPHLTTRTSTSYGPHPIQFPPSAKKNNIRSFLRLIKSDSLKWVQVLVFLKAPQVIIMWILKSENHCYPLSQ